MNSIHTAARFLNALAALEKPKDPATSRVPFVTISRETGAGGHTLARALVRAIEARGGPLSRGWHILDRELCRQVLQNPKILASMKTLMEELYRTPIEDMLAGLLSGSSPQPAVVAETFRVIRTAADMGKVVIVGRGGACVTHDRPQGLHVRLVAPLKTRVRRIMELENVSEPAAARLIDERDRDRARLVRDGFGKDIADPLLYHVVWNTGALPEKEIAEDLARLLDARFGQKTAGAAPS